AAGGGSAPPRPRPVRNFISCEVASCLGPNRGRMIMAVAAMPDSPNPPTPVAVRSTRPFVVVTGLSGAGRATALHVLEDLGYVAVDNIPLPLLGDLMRSTGGSLREMAAPLAFGVDTRTYGF